MKQALWPHTPTADSIASKTRPWQRKTRPGPLHLLSILLLVGLLLAGCADSTTPPSPTESAPVPTSTVPAQTVTPRPVLTPTPTPVPTAANAMIVGMLQDNEPDTLWPLGTLSDEQRTILKAVMEPAITTLNYDYQAVLFTEIPLLENGGAKSVQVQVPVDPTTGAIAITDTGVYTYAQQFQVTFKMREDLYWSDGQPLRASDSVFGYNVACAPGSGYAMSARCDKVESYEAVNDRTIRVTFKPGLPEMDYFTYYWDFMPEHAWSRYTPDEMVSVEQIAQRLSPSYGPYLVEDWSPGESITLVRNPYYVLHGEEFPLLDKIMFKFVPDAYSLLSQLLAGQIDLVEWHGLEGVDPGLLYSLEENGLLHVHTQPSKIWEHIDMNLNNPDVLSETHPFLGELGVRQALAYGTDRQGMAQDIYGTEFEPMQTWIPSEHWAYAGDAALDLYPYDPEQAAALLEEAGWILADDGFRYKDGLRMDLALYILAGRPLRERIAQLFQANMAALGLGVDVVRISEVDWYSEDSPLSRRSFDLVEFAWISRLEPDGRVNYLCDQIPSQDNGWRGQNYMGWCNEQANTALLEAAQTPLREERAELYQISQEQFNADMPSLPLFNQLNYYISRPGLRNLRLNPTEDITWNCWEWFLPAD
ncbi:MAG: peptide ABC transporter substrate-binding protein [Chloroflexia bacterium]|nr:peptide ABC transporter substrate-binding protein [Chloroflexia bacterium]